MVLTFPLDGLQELQAADMSAHKSVLQDPYFETHIVREAALEVLSTFSSALSCLVDSASADSSDNNARQLQEPEDLASEDSASETSVPSIIDAFQSTFIKAFLLKSKLVLCHGKFRIVFIYPGASFDPILMKPDGWTYDGFAPRGAGIPHETESAGPVKICLFPAVYALPSSPTDDLTEPLSIDSVLNYDNFIKDELVVNLDEAILVAKAIVLI